MPLVISIKTHSRIDMLDITPSVQESISNSSLTDGICVVYVPHTTAGITINEGADPAVLQQTDNAHMKLAIAAREPCSVVLGLHFTQQSVHRPDEPIGCFDHSISGGTFDDTPGLKDLLDGPLVRLGDKRASPGIDRYKSVAAQASYSIPDRRHTDAEVFSQGNRRKSLTWSELAVDNLLSQQFVDLIIQVIKIQGGRG